MLKTYKTIGQLAIKIPIMGGGAKQIVFELSDNNEGIYMTTDENVQRSLEKFHLFGNVYHLDREIDEKETAPSDEVVAEEGTLSEDGKTYHVVSLQEARNILIDEYGVNNGDIRGKAKTLSKASELGITFIGIE